MREQTPDREKFRGTGPTQSLWRSPSLEARKRAGKTRHLKNLPKEKDTHRIDAKLEEKLKEEAGYQ